MPTIFVEAFPGRTTEQKRNLVKDITEAVVKHFNVSPAGVRIIIREVSKENSGIGGVLYCDKET